MQFHYSRSLFYTNFDPPFQKKSRRVLNVISDESDSVKIKDTLKAIPGSFHIKSISTLLNSKVYYIN